MRKVESRCFPSHVSTKGGAISERERGAEAVFDWCQVIVYAESTKSRPVRPQFVSRKNIVANRPLRLVYYVLRAVFLRINLCKFYTVARPTYVFRRRHAVGIAENERFAIARSRPERDTAGPSSVERVISL